MLYVSQLRPGDVVVLVEPVTLPGGRTVQPPAEAEVVRVRPRNARTARLRLRSEGLPSPDFILYDALGEHAGEPSVAAVLLKERVTGRRFHRTTEAVPLPPPSAFEEAEDVHLRWDSPDGAVDALVAHSRAEELP